MTVTYGEFQQPWMQETYPYSQLIRYEQPDIHL